jgi:hypothetical protein
MLIDLVKPLAAGDKVLSRSPRRQGREGKSTLEAEVRVRAMGA